MVCHLPHVITTVIRIHLDSRHALQRLATGRQNWMQNLAETCNHQPEEFGERCLSDMGARTCRCGGKWVGRPGGKRGRSTRPKRQILMSSAFQQLQWFTLQEWQKEFKNMAQSKPAGTTNWIWNAVVVNPAQGYLLEFRDTHKEQSTNWSSTDSAPRLPTKHLLATLTPQPVHIVVMGMRRLNIYCCSAQNGQQNAGVTLVIRLTSQMCSRTMRVWWNSSYVPSYRQCLTGSSWQHFESNRIE